jgi:hypothetical protein
MNKIPCFQIFSVYVIPIFTITFMLGSCHPLPVNTNAQVETLETVVKNYLPDSSDFPNPERGFYRFSSTSASAYKPLLAEQLAGYQSSIPVASGSYSVVSTLLFRYFILDGFSNSPLTAKLLTQIKSDFAIARKAGIKLIVRFSYTNTTRAGNCGEGFICPPYGDAPKEVVLNHIKQLKPILNEEADVIACVQMGFIGTWGENYYTDYFGDASSNAGQGKLLDQNWRDRFEILQAFLDAIPANRMLQVRYPQLKQRFVYGVNAGLNSSALSAGEAFAGSAKSRIAFHNDCFLSGPDDTGTFDDYGNSSSPKQSGPDVIKSLRRYQADDSRYVVTGGETCMDTYSPQNDCENAGKAQTEMSDMHYSFLNADYNTKVNEDWEAGGCMQAIKLKLGYRFILTTAYLPKMGRAGKLCKLRLNLVNMGYASPYNPRPVRLVLRNRSTSRLTNIDLPTDIRTWFTGPVNLDFAVELPATLAPGEYELLLSMPDASASISSRYEYAIRLANRDMWEPATGYNNLYHVLVVE